jgi:hypothetical protein
MNDGTNKTATITSGEYLTPASLAQEITTQLNSVSSDWTCSYLSNYLFNIEHASTASLIFSSATSAAWDTLGYEQTVDSSATSFEADDVRIHTSETLDFDFTTAIDGNFFALISPMGEDFALSETGTIRVLANNIPIIGTGDQIDELIDRTDAGAFAFLTGGYRYWRVIITDRNNPNGPLMRFSNVYVGPYIEVTDRNISTGFAQKIIDSSNKIECESGSSLYNSKVKYDTFNNCEMQFLTKANRDTLYKMFKRIGNSHAIYISVDPDLAVSSTLDALTTYCRIIGDVNFSHQIRDYFNLSFAIEEVR